VSFNNML